jgi:hypothetical protein
MSLGDVLALAGKGVPGLDTAVNTGEAFSECAAFQGLLDQPWLVYSGNYLQSRPGRQSLQGEPHCRRLLCLQRRKISLII